MAESERQSEANTGPGGRMCCQYCLSAFVRDGMQLSAFLYFSSIQSLWCAG